MAKQMSKSEVETLAANAARTQPAVGAKTAHELEAMTYQDRSVAASRLANDAIPEEVSASKFGGHFLIKYQDTVISIWHTKMTNLRNARNRFARLAASMQDDESVKAIGAIVDNFRLRGQVRCSERSIEVTRGGESACLYLNFERINDEPVRNPDNEDHRINQHELNVSISWAGTSRSLTASATAIGIYQDLASLGAEIQATFERLTVVSVYGAPEVDPITAAGVAAAEAEPVAVVE